MIVSNPAPLAIGASSIKERVVIDWSGLLNDVAEIVASADDEIALVLNVAETATTVICAKVRVTRLVDLRRFMAVFMV